ncbi:MAG: hypothetical protein ACOCXA_06865 [Planctomycetota bacterium]
MIMVPIRRLAAMLFAWSDPDLVLRLRSLKHSHRVRRAVHRLFESAWGGKAMVEMDVLIGKIDRLNPLDISPGMRDQMLDVRRRARLLLAALEKRLYPAVERSRMHPASTDVAAVFPGDSGLTVNYDQEWIRIDNGL